MKKINLKYIVTISILFLIFVSSCRRENVPSVIDSGPTVVNDLVQVVASVSGIVLDENNIPLQGALVTSGSSTSTTNSFGVFNFNNISLSKNNGSVSVIKAGYYKAVRSFVTIAGNNHQLKIQMMRKILSGTINAASGGIINSNGSANISFPAGAIVTSTGAAYTGTVNIYSRWIDPTAPNLPYVIPGDLRGLNTNGTESILETYGMVGAELEDASGNVLKIATGKTATVSFPILTSMIAASPPTIVLWHFDNATARWKENGIATKTGNAYIAQVDKFSFWNCDIPSNFINLDYTIVTGTSNLPLASVYTKIKLVSSGFYGDGISNATGFVSATVPKNAALLLEVFGPCGNIIYTQAVGPYNANTSIGVINVTLPAAQLLTFTGTLQNCSGAVVTNGSVVLYAAGGFSAVVPVNAVGMFTFSTTKCSGINNYSFYGVDNVTNQQSNVTTITATTGIVNLGNIVACGTLPNEYINVILDGVPEIFSANVTAQQVIDNTLAGFTHLFDGVSYQTPLPAPSKACIFGIYNNNNSTIGRLDYLLIDSGVPNGPQIYSPGSNVNTVTFTQFGTTVGSFVAGNFTCQVFNEFINTVQTATCSFKLKRN
jgi:hypothetical protein